MANSASDIDATDARPTPHLVTTTRRCSEHGHREFVLRWDSRRTTPSDVESLATTLETSVAKGARFAPGDVVHVGWVPLRVVEAPSGMLSLVEPDFCGAPLRYVGGVDAALGHLRAQDDFAERVGLGGLIARPTLQDTVRVCGHLTSLGLVLDRVERDASKASACGPVSSGPVSSGPVSSGPVSSGWIVACGDPPEDDHRLQTVSIYELVCRFPHLVDFLALPAGITVACTDVGDAIVWQDGREVGARTGVSIAARLSRVTQPTPVARCGTT